MRLSNKQIVRETATVQVNKDCALMKKEKEDDRLNEW